MPVQPQKRRMGCIFQKLVWPFVVVDTITRHYLCEYFMNGQHLIARPVIAIVFHHGLEWA